MSCQQCGHPAETVNGQTVQPHNFGCSQSLAARRMMRSKFPKPAGQETVDLAELECEHGECSEPKRPWSGRGAKPKYCADGHK